MPDEDFFMAVASVDGEIVDYERTGNYVTIEVESGLGFTLAARLHRLGYTVYVDGIQYKP